jgi:hypothetical protein
LFAALFGLVRIALSDYSTLSKKQPLTHYEADEMIAKLHQAGYAAARSETNIGHNQWRMTFFGQTGVNALSFSENRGVTLD